LVLIGDDRDRELSIRGVTLDLAGGHIVVEISDVILVNSITIEPIEEDTVIFGVNDVIFGDVHTIKSFFLGWDIVKHLVELIAGESEGAASVGDMIKFVFGNVGCLEFFDDVIESLLVNSIESSSVSFVQGRSVRADDQKGKKES